MGIFNKSAGLGDLVFERERDLGGKRGGKGGAEEVDATVDSTNFSGVGGMRETNGTAVVFPKLFSSDVVATAASSTLLSWVSAEFTTSCENVKESGGFPPVTTTAAGSFTHADIFRVGGSAGSTTAGATYVAVGISRDESG